MPTRIHPSNTDHGRTVGLETVPIGHLAFPNNAVVLFRVRVVAARSDGASRAWIVDALVKKISGVLAIAENTAPVVLDSAADATALGGGVTIGLFSDGEHIGVNCTGQLGQTLDWVVDIHGAGLSA